MNMVYNLYVVVESKTVLIMILNVDGQSMHLYIHVLSLLCMYLNLAPGGKVLK